MSNSKSDIVFIPGLGCTSALFRHQTTHLGDQFNCHHFNHTEHDRIEDMVSVFLDTAPDEFALVGLSMGGYIAFEILRRAPEKVSKIVLLSTNALADQPEQTENRKRIIELIDDNSFDRVAPLLYPNFVHPARIDDPLLYAQVSEMIVTTGPLAFTNQEYAIIDRKDSRSDLPAFEQPTLMIVGEQDTVTPMDLAEEIAGLIPDCQLEVLQGCGHLPTLELPDQTTTLIADFLTS